MTQIDQAALKQIIEDAFEVRDTVDIHTTGDVREAVDKALTLMDTGQARVAEKGADGNWSVNQWLKMAVLLSFRLNPMEVIKGGPGDATWWDKVPSKFDGWGGLDFEHAGFRAVPNCIVRRSAFHRQGRRVDALLCQSRRLRGRGHHG